MSAVRILIVEDDAQDGVEIASRIRDAHGTPFVFVTSHSDKGARMVNKALDAAYDNRSPYAEQYCPDPAVKR